MVQRMAGAEGISAIKLAEEIGVHQTTLSRWLREAGEEKKERRGNVKSAPARERQSVRPDDLSPAEKFRLVMEASALSEDELGAFLRRNGLHEAQLQEWRQKVEAAALGALGRPKKRRGGKSPEAKRVQDLERELNRKDKALAEVMALLALKKKLDALLGGEDENTTSRNER
jgi:transposase-like protein